MKALTKEDAKLYEKNSQVIAPAAIEFDAILGNVLLVQSNGGETCNNCACPCATISSAMSSG